MYSFAYMIFHNLFEILSGDAEDGYIHIFMFTERKNNRFEKKLKQHCHHLRIFSTHKQ